MFESLKILFKEEYEEAYKEGFREGYEEELERIVKEMLLDGKPDAEIKKYLKISDVELDSIKSRIMH